jgi:hypothetical protein
MQEKAQTWDKESMYSVAPWISWRTFISLSVASTKPMANLWWVPSKMIQISQSTLLREPIGLHQHPFLELRIPKADEHLESTLHLMVATQQNTLSISRKQLHSNLDFWMLHWIKRVLASD